MTTESPKTTLSQKLSKALLDGGVIIALTTALLYIMGRAISIGDNSFWGLPGAFIVSTVTDTIYTGFLILNLKSATFLIGITFWLVAIFLFCHLYVYLVYIFTDKLKVLFAKQLEEKEYSERTEFYFEVVGSINKKSSMILLLVMIVLVFAVINGKFIQYGKENAQANYTAYKALERDNYLDNDGKKFYVLACDEDSCAIYVPVKDEIEIVSDTWLIGAKRKIDTTKITILENLDKEGNNK